VIFGLAALHSAFSAYAIHKGHEYYRRARAYFTMVERELGIIAEGVDGARYAMKTTRGMARETAGTKACQSAIASPSRI
jgi:hypothetical protein